MAAIREEYGSETDSMNLHSFSSLQVLPTGKLRTGGTKGPLTDCFPQHGVRPIKIHFTLLLKGLVDTSSFFLLDASLSLSIGHCSLHLSSFVNVEKRRCLVRLGG